MKVKLTETQYKSLLKFINEAVPCPVPENISEFFNKNPNTAYFTVHKLIEKTKQETEYLFRYEKINGIPTIEDKNPGTNTKGCITSANLDTMVYDDEFTLTFGKCNKTLTINNVVGIKLLDDYGHELDEKRFDNTSSTNFYDLVDKYNKELKNSNVGDELYFKTPKKEYDGTVLNQSSDKLEIEIHERGKKNNMLLYINKEYNGFYPENCEVNFHGIKKDVRKNTETHFNTPIKSFSSTNTGKPQEPEVNEPDNQEPDYQEPDNQELDNDDDDTNPNDIELSDEELEAQAKLAYDEILNDKNLQKAFYRKPSFWNLFMAELKGERAPGKGMVPTLQIVKGYKSNKIDGQLNGNFYIGKQVYFTPYKKDIYIYQEGTRHLMKSLKAGASSKAKVEDVKFGENTKQLRSSGHLNDLIVTIKSLTDVENVYKCDIEAITQKGGEQISGVEEDVYLMFNPASPGYEPIKRQTK